MGQKVKACKNCMIKKKGDCFGKGDICLDYKESPSKGEEYWPKEMRFRRGMSRNQTVYNAEIEDLKYDSHYLINKSNPKVKNSSEQVYKQDDYIVNIKHRKVHAISFHLLTMQHPSKASKYYSISKPYSEVYRKGGIIDIKEFSAMTKIEAELQTLYWAVKRIKENINCSITFYTGSHILCKFNEYGITNLALNKIFFSYNIKEKSIIIKLVLLLKRHNYRFIYDDESDEMKCLKLAAFKKNK